MGKVSTKLMEILSKIKKKILNKLRNIKWITLINILRKIAQNLRRSWENVLKSYCKSSEKIEKILDRIALWTFKRTGNIKN